MGLDRSGRTHCYGLAKPKQVWHEESTTTDEIIYQIRINQLESLLKQALERIAELEKRVNTRQVWIDCLICHYIIVSLYLYNNY